MAVDYEGPFDPELAAEAEKVYQEVRARYGTDERMIARSVKDQPEIILAVNYHNYAELQRNIVVNEMEQRHQRRIRCWDRIQRCKALVIGETRPAVRR